jgi:hypothetical protein
MRLTSHATNFTAIGTTPYHLTNDRHDAVISRRALTGAGIFVRFPTQGGAPPCFHQRNMLARIAPPKLAPAQGRLPRLTQGL